MPEPVIEQGYLIVINHFSLIPVGTEKIIVSKRKKSLRGKEHSRPNLMEKVLNSI